MRAVANALPIKEEYLLTGPLEPTNHSYALAKIAGIQMVNSYRQQFGYKWISLMPTNLYGPNDNYDPETSHVIPGMVSKFMKAKHEGDEKVILWGTGSPRREFLHVEDLASAILHMLQNYDGDIPLNIGTGEDITIGELAEIIAEIVGFQGEIMFDETKPDGAPKKLLDVSQASKQGWSSSLVLQTGLRKTVGTYMQHAAEHKHGSSAAIEDW